MTGKQALRALIEAVEAGEWRIQIPTGIFLRHHRMDVYRAFNGSLDAAKALQAALLPGWDADIEVRLVLSDATVYGCGLFEGSRENGTDESPSRAWLIAILKAYEAQQ